jgi:hypothetical protein
MKECGGVGVYIIFLSSELVGGEWPASREGRFTTGKGAPGTHWIGGRVGPRAGMDDAEKRRFLILPGFELRPFGRPVRNQSLYRLRYPGSPTERDLSGSFWGVSLSSSLHSARTGGLWRNSPNSKYSEEKLNLWISERACNIQPFSRYKKKKKKKKRMTMMMNIYSRWTNEQYEFTESAEGFENVRLSCYALPKWSIVISVCIKRSRSNGGDISLLRYKYVCYVRLATRP